MARTILYVHPSDELYGSDRCLLDIVRSLPEGDHAIVALPTDLPYGGALSRALEETGARVERVDMLVLRRALLAPRNLPSLARRLVIGTLALARLIQANDVDLVHSNTVAVVCGATAASLLRKPHLWHVHEHIGNEPRSYRALIRLLLMLPPGLVVANSRSVARALVGGSALLLARTRVVENSVNPEIQPIDRSGRDPAAPPVIGVLGRLSPRKGTGEAIEAAALLVARDQRFTLRFVGDAPPGRDDLRERYRALVHDHELQDYVVFAGEVPDVRDELAGFDILLLPSQRPEPFGLVVIEGMAAELPVVATLNGGGSDEILTHGRTGFYCGREPHSIAAALESLIDDPDLRTRIGRQAAEVASKRYTLARYTADFARLYVRLVPQKVEPGRCGA